MRPQDNGMDSRRRLLSWTSIPANHNISGRPHKSIRQGLRRRTPTTGGSLCTLASAYFSYSSV